MADEEARTRIYPLSRAAFPGSESRFEVEVEGAEFGIYGKNIGYPFHFTKAR